MEWKCDWGKKLNIGFQNETEKKGTGVCEDTEDFFGNLKVGMKVGRENTSNRYNQSV